MVSATPPIEISQVHGEVIGKYYAASRALADTKIATKCNFVLEVMNGWIDSSHKLHPTIHHIGWG
jgi:hypothetical protein